ncbi:hypothetical protein [Mucilaginibacter rubeus]|uniref:Uncharacterized protein n=1 Tax=Mucilaginibacter rubeus TaxID=2027860 RepID=A0A5C1HWA9_9SPHI|nr:hypothetical protein [Mucilaginibacter rubeus]QEM09955.1 hypothetical protein DEO27_007945 [Mucilaginibacter rubeus]
MINPISKDLLLVHGHGNCYDAITVINSRLPIMKALTFNNLCFFQQMELVLKGTRLAMRHSGPYYIYLYNVRELYVEVFYDAGTDIIEFIKAFTDTKQLSPYIEEIFISSGS